MADQVELERQLAEKDRQIAELQTNLQSEVALLKRLVQVTTQLNSTHHLDELLQLVMKAGADLLQAEASSLMLVDEETGELTFEIATGAGADDVLRQRVPRGQGIAGWVVDHGESEIVNDP